MHFKTICTEYTIFPLFGTDFYSFIYLLFSDLFELFCQYFDSVFACILKFIICEILFRIVSDVVSIFIGRRDGERLVALVDNGTRVLMHIFFSRTLYNPANSVNRTSVMFVTISFILLMVISGAWLIFYYMQRFRYVHTKDRLSVLSLGLIYECCN